MFIIQDGKPESIDPISVMTGYWVYSTKDDSVPLQYNPSQAL